MKNKITNNILVATFLAALVSPVLASDLGIGYIGTSVGSAKADDFCKGFFIGSCDDTDTGWKLFGGFQYTPNWGVEVYYVDFGEFKANATFEGMSFTENAEANAFGISAIGTLPINDQFDVFAKVGISRWELDLDFTDEGIPSSVDDDGSNITFGIGASYFFNRLFAIRVEWELSKIGDHHTTGEDDVGLVSIGAVLYF